MSLTLAGFTPFGLLLLAVLGLWMHRLVWMGALVAAVAAGYVTGALRDLAIVWIAILGLLAWSYRWLLDQPLTRARVLQCAALALLFFLFALAVGLLLLPGFARTVLVKDVVLSPGAAPYTLGLGFAKVVTGIFILGFINTRRVGSWAELSKVLRRSAPVFLATVSAVLIGSLLLGYVAFAPKWTTLFFIWALANLFFTCLAEEAFFRGFLQQEIARLGGRGYLATVIAMTTSAVLFGLAHAGGGWRYVSLATVAGLGYALAYRLSERIEAAMAVHFGVNAVHFLLFTYPALAT